MLIVRFAMPASCRVRWNSAIAFAVIAESGTSPKCFLTRLSRSSSSSIVRGEHRIRLAVQVGVDRLRQPLRSLFVGRQPAVSSLFDQLALSARRRSQVRRAETLPVSTAGDGEVCPVPADRVSRDSYGNSPSSESPSDEETDGVSTALARTKSATSDGRYRTERPSRRNRGPFPRCLHARSVATDSPSSSATSRSVSARVASDRVPSSPAGS